MRGLICGLVIGAFIQWYTDQPTAPAPTVAPSPAAEEEEFDDLFEDDPFATEDGRIPGDATIWSPDNPTGYMRYEPKSPVIIGHQKRADEHLSR